MARSPLLLGRCHLTENLSFMGANFVFKHSGAFFIRRSFGNDELYKAIFDTYLLQLLQDRNSVELFIEGTRSRSGKLLRPRMGMMSMMTDAILENELEDLLCCPVAVQYEKVLHIPVIMLWGCRFHHKIMYLCGLDGRRSCIFSCLLDSHFNFTPPNPLSMPFFLHDSLSLYLSIYLTSCVRNSARQSKKSFSFSPAS
mgnify:CR=1 FL=1